MKMTEGNFDPEAYRQRLHEIIRQVPSGVSREDLVTVLPTAKDPDEMKSYLESAIIASLNTTCGVGIDRLWRNLKISEKLIRVKELEKTSPKEPAWRPTTGETFANQIILARYLEMKEELQDEIGKLQEESTKIKTYLKNFCEMTENEIPEIQKLSDLLEEWILES